MDTKLNRPSTLYPLNTKVLVVTTGVGVGTLSLITTELVTRGYKVLRHDCPRAAMLQIGQDPSIRSVCMVHDPHCEGRTQITQHLTRRGKHHKLAFIPCPSTFMGCDLHLEEFLGSFPASRVPVA